jgi:hypothetical protein
LIIAEINRKGDVQISRDLILSSGASVIPTTLPILIFRGQVFKIDSLVMRLETHSCKLAKPCEQNNSVAYVPLSCLPLVQNLGDQAALTEE